MMQETRDYENRLRGEKKKREDRREEEEEKGKKGGDQIRTRGSVPHWV